MKNLLTSVCLLIAFCTNAQTTITASYVSSVVTFSTGVTYVTFAVRNTNPYPVTITNMTSMQANLYEDNVFSLWYSVTSLSGAPTVSSPVWTQVATSLQPSTVSVIGQVTPFNCIGLVIPPMTTYRFALQGSKGSAARGAVTPNIFSAGGVDLLVGDNISTGGQVGYFGWQNLGNAGAAYFFDGSITFAQSAAYTDIEVLAITKPASACSATSSTLMAQVCNKSPHTVNFAATPANVNFNVSGPIPYSASVPLTAGSIAPCGCINATLGGVNFSASGNYTITATASITGVTDANPVNNTAVDSIRNYKPVISPAIDSVCQFTSGPLFGGFSGSACQPRQRTFTVNTVLAPTPPVDGNSNATAGLFAQSSLPGLPSGAIITGGRLLITNLNSSISGSFGNEARFSIYSPSMGAGAPLVPGVTGSPLNFSMYNFDYAVDILPAQLNNMYALIGAGGVFSIGYWETVDNLVGGSDIALHGQTFLTQARLYIEYTVPPDVKWFSTPSGGSSFYTGSVMNPFTSPSGLANTNTVGNFTFYAACSADTVCRIPIVLKVKPSPAVVQDSLASCELISSSGNGSFDLTSVSGPVSAFNPLATVTFYQDPSLSLFISNPTNYSTNTNFVYSKVQVGSCYSSDSLYLLVHPKPQFISALVTGAVCQPDYVDATNLIDPFSSVSPGTDTLYFDDAAYSVPHPNPHSITSNDTVYMLFVTNTTPACMDSSEAIINVFPLNDFIVGQDTNFNFSIPGSISCTSLMLTDGQHDTLYSTTDCSRIASVFDAPDGVSLGNTIVCEDIDPAVQFHNGQPYVNRHYQITPAANDSAMVCLYYLDDDLQQYNNAAFGLWPLLPTAANPTLTNHLCIAQVHNGDLNTPGHTVTSIPYTAITSSYDASTTVWTICFPVDSFSHFYLHAQNPLNIPLPAELIRFTANSQGNNVRLEWTTANEQNNQYFIAERSENGTRFSPISEPISSKAINGNSLVNLDYACIDKYPMQGLNYYRLQQTDIDGKKQYSHIVTVFKGNERSVRVYPNPVANELNVEIQSLASSVAHLKIMDVAGRLLRVVELNIQAGTNRIQVDVASLKEDMYFISVSDTQGLHYTGSFRKQ